MHATNLNPLANPLNDRPIGNLNFNKLQSSGYFKSDLNAKLPDSSFSYDDYLIQQKQLHVPDTSHDSSILGNNNLDMRSYGKSWNNYDPLEDVRDNIRDIQYQKYVQLQNQKLCSEMSDEQKELLKTMHEYVRQSKLIDESKK